MLNLKKKLKYLYTIIFNPLSNSPLHMVFDKRVNLPQEIQPVSEEVCMFPFPSIP